METKKDKKNKDVNVAREWVKLFIGIGLAVFGMFIVAYSLIVPPVGAIHATVVTTFGTILTFVGAIFGIDSNAKIRMHEQDVDFELRSKELDDRMRQFEMRLERGFNETEEKKE